MWNLSDRYNAAHAHLGITPAIDDWPAPDFSPNEHDAISERSQRATSAQAQTIYALGTAARIDGGAVPDQMRRPVIIRIYIPAIALFCKTRATTRRFSACPSAVVSLPTWRLSPIAAGAIILVRGT